MKNAFFVTASIACGKSTFIEIANSLGFKSISADKISHEILDENALELEKIFSQFSLKNLLTKEQKIDRKILGEIIFNNKEAKKILENFIHPKIRVKILEQMQILDKENKTFFVEIPLFFESGAYKNLGKVIVIYASKELSLKRILQRDKLSLESAKARLSSQIDIEEKLKKADFIIKNTSSYADFRQECVKVIQEISIRKNVKFYKYCASGNDFIITNANEKQDRSTLAKELCNRYKGIGADGFIVILPHEKYDFEWEFYNNDGSRALMCGNGSRAAAHFAHHINKINPNMSFLTGAGIIKANVNHDRVEVSLGKIKSVQNTFEELGKTWQLCDTGVPHLVHFCENLDEFDIILCQKMRQKYNANVNFVKILDKNSLKVRTYERGVEDETLACGTGMGACFYLAFLNKKVQNEVKITPKSGEEVGFKYKNEELFFEGKVKYCFEANYNFS